MNRQRGQVLAFFALVLPIILVPIVAYAIDAAALSSKAADLQAAAAQAAEVAVQQVDSATLRSSGRLTVDMSKAEAAARGVLAADEPRATLDHITVDARTVEVFATEQVELPLPWQLRSIVLHAHATARLVPGYANPSSRLPLPTSTF